MPWLITMGPKDIGTRMLLNQLPPAFANGQTQQKLAHLNLWPDLDNGIPALCSNPIDSRKQATGGDRHI